MLAQRLLEVSATHLNLIHSTLLKHPFTAISEQGSTSTRKGHSHTVPSLCSARRYSTRPRRIDQSTPQSLIGQSALIHAIIVLATLPTHRIMLTEQARQDEV